MCYSENVINFSFYLKEKKMIGKGTKVKWKWGKGVAEGTVKDTFDRDITTTIKGAKITRKGKPDNKALYIQQENGNEVLKLTSEVERAD